MESLTGDWHRLLEETFLFRDVPEAAAAALNDPRCRRSRVARGEIIYSPREFQQSLGVVLEGRVQVNKGDIIMSVLERGDLFGAAALFHRRGIYATTLTARTECELLLLPQELVEDLMARFPVVGRNYVLYLSERIWFLTDKIEALTAGSAERKLAQYLLVRAQDGRVESGCSVTGLAQRLGVSRASLYRAMDALAQSGAILREDRGIRILDETQLQGI